MLKGLDEYLEQGSFQEFDGVELPGIDGKPYMVRKRNNFLASRSDATWARRQGLSLMAYCQYFAAVPSHPIQGIRIVSRPPYFLEQGLSPRPVPRRTRAAPGHALALAVCPRLPRL